MNSSTSNGKKTLIVSSWRRAGDSLKEFPLHLSQFDESRSCIACVRACVGGWSRRQKGGANRAQWPEVTVMGEGRFLNEGGLALATGATLLT